MQRSFITLAAAILLFSACNSDRKNPETQRQGDSILAGDPGLGTFDGAPMGDASGQGDAGDPTLGGDGGDAGAGDSEGDGSGGDGEGDGSGGDVDPGPCAPGEFVCADGESCIDEDKVCDHYQDCLAISSAGWDISDEQGCLWDCETGWECIIARELCWFGTCLPPSCVDDTGCPSTTTCEEGLCVSPVTCSTQEECPPDSHCVTTEIYCSSVDYCPTHTCYPGCPNLFRCEDGYCIDPSLTCDGIIDCGDGSDENASTCATVWNGAHDFCASGWCAVYPAAPRPLNDVYVRSSGNVVAVGNAGTVVVWNGSQWHRIPSQIGLDLYAVDGNGTDLWAVGERGILLHWNIATGIEVTQIASYKLNDIWLDESGVGYVVGDEDTLLYFDGTSWSDHPHPAPLTGTLSAVWGSGPNDVWFGSEYAAGLYQWDGSDYTYHPVGGAHITSIWGDSPQNVWAGGETGVVWHYDGSEWTSVSTLTDIYGAPLTIEALWGDGAGVWESVVGGLFWDDGVSIATNQSVVENSTITGIDGASANDVWFVGGIRGIGTPTSALQHWDGAEMTDAGSVTGIADYQIVNNELVAILEVGRVTLLDLDGGVFRTEVPWEPIVWVSPSLWAGSSEDIVVLHSTSVVEWDGTAWSESSPPGGKLLGGNVSDVFMVRQGESLGADTVLHRQSPGVWTVLPDIPETRFESIAVTPGGDLILGGQLGKVHVYNGSWREHDTGLTDPITHVDGFGSNIWAAGYTGGKLAVFDGTTWSIQPVGEENDTVIDLLALPDGVALSMYSAALWDYYGLASTSSGGWRGFPFAGRLRASNDFIWLMGSPNAWQGDSVPPGIARYSRAELFE